MRIRPRRKIRRRTPPADAKKVRRVWVTPNGSVYRKIDGWFVKSGEVDRTRALEAFPPPATKRRSKLAVRDVLYIKGQLEAGCSQAWLARRFDVTPQAIYRIAQGKIWGHIEAPIAELEGPPKGVHLTEDMVQYYESLMEE